MANGFIVEPGSNWSVSTRLRTRSKSTVERSFGSYVGSLASAMISPVLTSATTTAPALA